MPRGLRDHWTSTTSRHPNGGAVRDLPKLRQSGLDQAEFLLSYEFAVRTLGGFWDTATTLLPGEDALKDLQVLYSELERARQSAALGPRETTALNYEATRQEQFQACDSLLLALTTIRTGFESTDVANRIADMIEKNITEMRSRIESVGQRRQ